MENRKIHYIRRIRGISMLTINRTDTLFSD